MKVATQDGPAPSAAAGHPRGLYLLSITELWERMSYYGMRCLLVFYLVDKAPFGLGWSEQQALTLFGWYTALVWLTPTVGGYLADRFLGQRRAVLIGGTLMMSGQFLLVLPGKAFLLGGLGMLILGNGLFKPNISTMVGGLYRPDDARRDSAYSIFYMGINVGLLLSSLVCGTLGERVAWRLGFASAGLGMALGLLVFGTWQRRLLGEVGLRTARFPAGESGGCEEKPPPLSPEERDRILTLFIMLLFVTLFWAAFEQVGGLVNLYTRAQVDRRVLGWEVPATWFQGVNSLFIILLSPVFARLWTWLAARNRDPSPAVKMGFGLLFAGAAFGVMVLAAFQNASGHKANPLLLVATYLLLTVGELCLSPVGLSLVTKLAPGHLVSRLMGIWFLGNFAGSGLAGYIGTKASRYGNGAVFAAIALVTSAMGLLLLGLSRSLLRMMHGAADIKPVDRAEEPSPQAPAAPIAGG